MPTPTDVLRAEHRTILRALAALETAAGRDDVEDRWWTEAAAWLRDFADRSHHGKEERWLFPTLVAAGVPDEGGPVGVMLAEHDQGRALVRAIASERGAARAAVARQFVALLRAHIDKEDGVLFPLAESVLDGAAQARLAAGFAAVADELGRDGSAERAAARLDALLAALDPATPGYRDSPRCRTFM